MTNIFFPTTFYKQIWARKKHVLEYPKLDFVGIFLLWDVVEMLSNSMFLLPPKRTPNVQNPYVCQTLSNLVVDLVHIHIHIHPMQICFFPTSAISFLSQIYPNMIPYCPIFVCSFCMFFPTFFVDLPCSSPVGCVVAVQNKPRGATSCPVFGTAQREFRGENCGVEKVRCNLQWGTLQEWYSQWMRWTITKVTWIYQFPPYHLDFVSCKSVFSSQWNPWHEKRPFIGFFVHSI